MDLLLTGTGPAGGFPAADCPCATCRTARSTSPAGALPRDVLAQRRPAELRLGEQYRLDVHGVLYDGQDQPHRLDGGHRLELPGIVVHALAEPDGPVTLLIHPQDGPPLLWAPQAGRVSTAIATELLGRLAGTSLATLILGPVPEHDPDEPEQTLTPVECALGLARLRAIGVVDDHTACVLIGIGHRQGPADRLAVCLEHWRAEAPVDGTRLTATNSPGRRTGDAPLGRSDSPAVLAPVSGSERHGDIARAGRTLVLGGSASGKSGLAEDLLAAEPHVLYTATGPVVDLRNAPDAEWAQRVRRHRERRPDWWQTEETHLVAELLWKTGQPILLDSIGTWLTGVLDRAGAWQDEEDWRDRVAAETQALVRAWRFRRAPLVAVSDEVGLGVVPETSAGRLFRDELGRLNRRLAQESERVLIVVAGRLLHTGAVLPGDEV
jgi:adenosylcobinamide kinase / adenosylcobinamide-phosphate guanylyltransferase